MDDQRVTVAIRVRPKIDGAMNATQTAERYQAEAVHKVSEDTVRISETKGKDVKSVAFTYDYVFDRDSTQEELYEETTQASIDGALEGKHATIMTYGQTGSGKTYTVLGSVKANPLAKEVVTADTGLFIRAVRDLMQYSERRSKDLHVVVGLSVVEIYLDSIRDLLSKGDTAKPIKPIIDQDNVQLPELTVQHVTNLRDAVDVYKVATSKRVARATDANDQSSRSHALFFIEIFQIPKQAAGGSSPAASPVAGDLDGEYGDEDPGPCLDALIAARDKMLMSAKLREKYGGNKVPVSGFSQPALYSKIVLTDLAGSEKLKHSNATGQGFEEMKEINKSLTALGNVVHALFSGAKHIPYRDTRLTILLRSTFSAPDARVVLIANVAPTALTYDETQSTLFFANKVKAMNASKSGASGSDLKSETEYLSTLRVTEELFADLRIVKESHHFSPLISCGIMPKENATAQRLRLGAPGTTAAKKFEPTKHPNWVEAQRMLELRVKSAADAKVSGRDDLEVQAHKEIFGGLTESYRSKRKALEAEHAKELVLAAEGSDSWKKNDAEQLGLTQSLDQEAMAVEKLVFKSKSDIETKKVRLDQGESELAVTKEKLEACIQAFMEKNTETETEWKKWGAQVSNEDHLWSSQSEIVDQAKEVGAGMENYVNALQASSDEYKLGVKLRHSCDMIEFRAELKETLLESSYAHYVTQYREKQARLKEQQAAHEAATGMRPAPKSRPKKASHHADPNDSSHSDMVASASPQPEDELDTTKRVSAPKRPANAPPRKPPSLFDVPTLLGNIIEYVECGASLLKHGRSGKPHYRFFYVYREVPQGEDALLNSGECRSCLCWVDEEPSVLKLTANAVDLSHVTSIKLGKGSAVFDRSFKPRDGLQDNEYYSSFSIHYQNPNESSSERTMDIVCEMTSELESWVIGLCYLSRVNPVFARPLDVTSEGSLAAMPSLDQIETDMEKEMVSTWHVPPKLWVSIISKLARIAERRRMRKAMITPGELCAIAQIDIFRSTAMWRLLVDQALILKPRFLGRSFLEFDKVTVVYPSSIPSRPPPTSPSSHRRALAATTTGVRNEDRDVPAFASTDPGVPRSKRTAAASVSPAPTPSNGESDFDATTNSALSSASPRSSQTIPKSPAPKRTGDRGSAAMSPGRGATGPASPKAPVRPPPKGAGARVAVKPQ